MPAKRSAPAKPYDINVDRIREEFLELVSIASPSKREGAIARRLESILKGMGASVEVDDAGERVGGETGNLLARFPGNKPGVAPILLSAHMDTVGPAERIRPVAEGDIVRTDGTSVLGGDDKAGIVAIFEAIRTLRERQIPHG
ncbi:MAG TPA: peptidase M20, partial [Methylomirabilota bacterium]|nr:peptidase M20 [Methylomirabilota bacterium]